MDKIISSFHFIAIIIKDCELKCVYVENKIPVIQHTIFQLVNLFFVMKILGFFLAVVVEMFLLCLKMYSFS